MFTLIQHDIFVVTFYERVVLGELSPGVPDVRTTVSFAIPNDGLAIAAPSTAVSLRSDGGDLVITVGSLTTRVSFEDELVVSGIGLIGPVSWPVLEAAYLATAGSNPVAFIGEFLGMPMIVDPNWYLAYAYQFRYLTFSDGVTLDLMGGVPMRGGNGHDTLHDFQGNERLGTFFNDTIDGQGGNDYLVASFGNNLLLGGAGNDTLTAGAGADTLDGGSAVDMLMLDRAEATTNLVVRAGTVANIGDGTRISNFEVFHVTAGSGNDSLAGGTRDDYLVGGAGADTLSAGGGGRDHLDGGTGNDLAILNYATLAGQVSIGQGFTPGIGLDHFVVSLAGTLATRVYGVERLHVTGGSGNDNLTSVFAGDRMDGGAGVDTLFLDRAASTAKLTILAGAAAHSIGDGSVVANVESLYVTTGSGNDSLVGGAFTDALDGGAGADTLVGGGGNDVLQGGAGNDVAVVDHSASAIPLGVSFDDRMGTADDAFIVTAGTQRSHIQGVERLVVTGGSGNDNITSVFAGDRLDGGAGFDTLFLDRAATTARLTISAGAVGQAIGDGSIVSNFESLFVTAGSGNDSLVGGSLTDVLEGGAGNDTLAGGGGNDFLYGGVGNDLAILDASALTVALSFVFNDQWDTESDHFILSGGGRQTSIYGVERFALTGGSGNDNITSLLAGDTMDGGAGVDTLFLDRAASTARLTVRAEAGAHAIGDGSTIANFERLHVAAGAGNDSLVGGTRDDHLEGGAGNDTLVGGGGNDHLFGGAGNDLAIVDRSATTTAFVLRDLNDGWPGPAQLQLVSGTQVTQIHDVERVFVTGGSGNDTIESGAGNDTLIGGLGADRMTPGGGADTIRYLTPTQGNDVIVDYVMAADRIEVSASGFGGGLVAGMSLTTTGRSLMGANVAPTLATGQFLFDTLTRSLSWDADGTGAGAAVRLFTQEGASDWRTSEIVVIA